MANAPGLPSSAPATLEAAELPTRVREILFRYLDLASRRLAPAVDETLRDAQRQLMALASESHVPARQSTLLAAVQVLRTRGDRLLPALLADIESRLAAIRLPQVPDKDAAAAVRPQAMTLVEDEVLDQEIVLREIARHCESRCGATLHALGLRFGALAASAVFEPGQVPVGPQSLCRSLREAAPVLQLGEQEPLFLLYRAFERKALAQHDMLLESLNALLADQGVLPSLVHSPRRARNRRERGDGSGRPAAHAGGTQGRPLTGWHGQGATSDWSILTGPPAEGIDENHTHTRAHTHSMPAAAVAEAAEDHAFAALRQILQGRRVAMAGHEHGPAPAASGLRIDTGDVLARLGGLQAETVEVVPGRAHRTFRDVQQRLLAESREAHGRDTALDARDADNFELLDMLYREIEREVKPDAPCVELLVRLQVPVARASLLDRRFFTSPRHPARELLNAVAESGAAWLEGDDADPLLVQKMQTVVERVVTEYSGDDAVLERASRDIQQHLDAAARRAALSERRHVEAAQGKDRLEASRRDAGDAIALAFSQHKPDPGLRKVLDQVWQDVLTLTLLRKGESSAEWLKARDLTERIATAGAHEPLHEDPTLAAEVAEALRGSGFGDNEAGLFSARLASPHADLAGAKQLDALLEARAWLGQRHAGPAESPPPRDADEDARHSYLLTLPFGTWFEFVKNQQGDVMRRRLSWYSSITDNALFVNQQGKRVAETTLDKLAREMARDQVRVVVQDKGRLIDRAWRATLDALRTFSHGAGP